MIVDVMPKDMRSSAIAINLFVYTIISDVWVVLLGTVLDSVDSDQHPRRVGYWLAVFVCSLYLLAFPCYMRLGCHHAAYKKKAREFESLSNNEHE